MRIKILSWNVREANCAEKRKLIKALQKVNLVCIQETKIKGFTRRLLKSLVDGRFVDWATANAEGSLGGILIC